MKKTALLLLPDRMISDFAGHKDISTTQKYYIHSVTPLTEKADVFAKVFGSKAMLQSVTKIAKEKSLENSRLFLKNLMRKMGLEPTRAQCSHPKQNHPLQWVRQET